MSYAEKTSVPVERSRAEIEGLLRKYGADQFVSGWEEGRAMVGFRCQGRFIRFLLAFPSVDDAMFRPKRRSRFRSGAQAQVLRHEAEMRRRWRALALVIKAKLEAVETGITTFENEFLAHIVMPDGKTIGQHVTPTIAAAYESGRMPPLLPAWSGGEA